MALVSQQRFESFKNRARRDNEPGFHATEMSTEDA